MGELSKNLVEVVSPGRELVIINEGSETDEFFETLGGYVEYSKVAVDFDKPVLNPRLFHCVMSTAGDLRAFEISHFEQENMVPEDVMILDSGDEIYLWVGEKANTEEKEK